MKQFDYTQIKNPQFFEENRLKAHSDHVCYKNEAQLNVKETSLRKSLDGIWKFSFHKNFFSVDLDFVKKDYDCKTWDDITVPGHIQMQGYGVPQYLNTQYPWDGSEDIIPGEIPTEDNQIACYEKKFTVPKDWDKNSRICISFQGVESGFALFLNGEYVGYSENSFDPADFDLTDYLIDGENKLAVIVFKLTSSSWCEDQDFYRFSGIYRSVFLYEVPKCHLQDLSVVPVLSEDLSEANVEIGVKTRGKGTISLELKERIQDVCDVENASDGANLLLDGKEIIEIAFDENSENTQNDNYVDSVMNTSTSASFEVKKMKLWSAEEPNLYTLYVKVYDDLGNLVECTSQLVGFRKFEIKDSVMHLNGKRIVFKGVNRHEFSSVTGRKPNKQDAIKDIITMKKNNINAIRTCHYPDDSFIYELCDIYGIYMIAENNLETHGTWDAFLREKATEDYLLPYNKVEWKQMLLDRVNSCYQRDKNHPAILIWSCGNEAYGGRDIYEMSCLFKKLDKHRLVHYEGVTRDRTYNDTTDIESQMYTPVEGIKEFLSEHKDKPFICCEYTHAMGNSCGGMKKYTDLTDTNPLYQGGFIWDFIDQSIYKKDRYGKWFLAYGGDFKERPTDYNFSGNGIVYGGERNPSPKMVEVKYNYQNISVDFVEENKFVVINKNLFTNTNKYDAVLELLENGQKIRTFNLNIEVEPLSKKEFMIPNEVLEMMETRQFAADSLNKNKLEFAITISFRIKKETLWAKVGHEVAFGQKVYKVRVLSYACSEKLEVVNGKFNVGVKGKNFKALFSFINCGLTSYVYAGREMIEKIPMPNFWRAPVDNDCGCRMPQRYAQWKIASLYISGKQEDGFENLAPEVIEKENSVQIIYTYYMPTVPASKVLVTYEVFGDGTIQTTLSYDVVKELGDMPEFGMLFKLDADYENVEWYGLGEVETYVDRLNGAKLGVYKNKVADNMAKYLVPQECGNKCQVRYAKITDIAGHGMIFFGDELSFSALPYTPHEIENAQHEYELPQVHYTVVRVAKQQMGIAGDDSWGAKVHEEYLIDTKNNDRLEFKFCFRGI
ncbi:glycoside hydrolase family 2 TIM barrel-domain containing protein [Lachnobacterium bovis]|uniref:glycoside hydrolase family 2 TIM barrel-domain containing protein n=1 Tax=Lachnobacterium bovis TaxID=140626 RepID=UPI0004842913|nr:glycoside hydrolase family 2 TIM barrel-domain containing protein [Lachnobacterium bovis]